MANKLIQLKDGSDNLYLMNPVSIDIASQFTWQSNVSSFTKAVFAQYDREKKRVHGSFYVYGTGNDSIPISTPFLSVASPYKPKDNYGMAATIVLKDGTTYPYAVVFNSSGNIQQGFASTAQRICCTFEYEV